MERSKGWVRNSLCYDFWWRTGDELDYSWRNTCFSKDLVDYVVGVGGGR